MKNSVMQTKPKKYKKLCTVVLVFVLVLTGFVVFQLTYASPGPVEITVTSDKQSYSPGETVHFSIYVYNPQNWRVFYPYSYTCGIHNVWADIFGQSPHLYGGPSFPPHNTTLYRTIDWHQNNIFENGTQVMPGNYTVTVELKGQANYGPPATCIIEIKDC
ncbi:MAG: hypothetical protein NWF01_05235 [Candidatus Bathyarchaeota archaeon]|nr:hypothetical protein [Candidatus Bathyarchaeota archaeon]